MSQILASSVYEMHIGVITFTVIVSGIRKYGSQPTDGTETRSVSQETVQVCGVIR